MRTGSTRSIIRLTILTMALLAVGCHKNSVANSSGATPPPQSSVGTSNTPPVQPTVTLQAAPTIVQSGQPVTLRWSSTNATSLALAPGLGAVAPEGSTTATPSASTTYTITATGPGGSAQATARVTVTPGAPTAPATTESTLDEMFLKEVQDAFFDLDKADIRTDARDALSKTGQFLRSYPQIKVIVEGHCDERGSTEYNIALGDRRAQAAKNFLVSLGVAADRMQTVSYGKERPFCTTHDENCWQQNRRAHFAMAK